MESLLELRWIRIALAAAAGLLFVAMALRHDKPALMLVGLVPLAMLAVEALWQLFDRADNDA